MMSSTIFISAGEASGEHYGALLIGALQRRLEAQGRPARFIGMGGTRMEKAGLERVVRAEEMAVMGVTEVVMHLPRVYGGYRKLQQAIRQHRPDVAVLIDFPDVHFRLAEELSRLGTPVVYFVSPQLWAWKQHRIRLVRNYVRRMLVIFPFEEAFYRERGVAAEFVGHPLAELPLPTISREQFAAANGLHADRTWIALLPGSRSREICDHLPQMLEAARSLSLPAPAAACLSAPAAAYPSTPAAACLSTPAAACLSAPAAACPSDKYEFLVPLAPTLSDVQRAEAVQLAQDYGSGLEVRAVDDARAALFHARAAVVASGTATVEAALIGNPFVVVYRVSPATYAVAKMAVKVPHVAMANLIAGKRVVPELIQNDFTAANIVKHLEPLLPDGPARQSMMQELAAVRDALSARPTGERAGKRAGGRVGDRYDGMGAIERVAAIALEEMDAAVPAASSNSA